MEEIDSISVAVSNIDINKVEALEGRRVVAFINHFLCTTVTFLNLFTSKCEQKLDNIQQKLFRIDTALRILESKLESLPNLSTDPSNSNSNKTNDKAPEKTQKAETETGSETDDDVSESDKEDVKTVSLSMSSTSTKDNDPEETISTNPSQETESKEISASSEEKPTRESLKQDPRYAKYFKMMYVGVPAPAIKQKMASEGVDPSILDVQ